MAKRILIIEDDPDILDILNIIFIDEGFDIVALKNGMSAYEIGLFHPDLIVLDVRISGFDKTGAEICAELKASTQTNHLPVLLLSAENELKQIATNCGADGHISKPFAINNLIGKVKEMMD